MQSLLKHIQSLQPQSAGTLGETSNCVNNAFRVHPHTVLPHPYPSPSKHWYVVIGSPSRNHFLNSATIASVLSSSPKDPLAGRKTTRVSPGWGRASTSIPDAWRMLEVTNAMSSCEGFAVKSRSTLGPCGRLVDADIVLLGRCCVWLLGALLRF